MTRLVVTADAEADTNDILTYLEEKAGPLVAARYGHRFASRYSALSRCLRLVRHGALGPDVRIAIVYPYL